MVLVSSSFMILVEPVGWVEGLHKKLHKKLLVGFLS
jgi:hypothetical protein